MHFRVYKFVENAYIVYVNFKKDPTMRDSDKKLLIEKIQKYGQLMAEGRKFAAQNNLKLIEKTIKTDREQFFDWLDE
jgi:hypothetical protein